MSIRLNSCVNKRRWSSSNNIAGRLQFQLLEPRVTPTTDIILDFDGGTLQNGQGYGIPGGFNFTNLQPFTAIGTTGPGGQTNRTEQIYQIIAGVRQDFADFDVNVIWDDRGVTSPFYNATDTVAIVTGSEDIDAGFFGLFGIASSVDLNQSKRDTCFTFEPGHQDPFAVDPLDGSHILRELITTISHEIGHTIGQSHTDDPDPEQRQLMGNGSVPFSQEIDSWFTPTPLNHSSPEAGVIYAERDRCFQNLGKAGGGKTLTANELHSSQALLMDTPGISVDAQSIGLFSGNITFKGQPLPMQIDHGGDRDAYQVTLIGGTSYAIRQRASGSQVDPVVSLWNGVGDYVGTGSVGSVGGVSTFLFTPPTTGTYFVVAGTTFDRTASGTTGTPRIGAYNLEISPGWLEINSVTKSVTVTGTSNNDGISAVKVSGAVNLTLNSSTVQIASLFTKAVFLNGAAGNDTMTINLSGGAITCTISDTTGVADNVVINGTSGNDTFDVSTASVISNAGAKITLFSIERLTVNGLAGNDGFSVAAGSFIIAINGGAPNPPANPGDSIGVIGTDPVQIPSTPTDGTFVFNGQQPVIYTGIDTFGGVVPPTPTAPPKNSFAVGAGAGSLPSVSFHREGKAVTYSVMAYDPGFRGGVRVATGDVDGDGITDLITAAGVGGGPHVQVFNGNFPVLIDSPAGSFFAYDSGFTGGVFVAAGDVNGDGRADIITGADSGGGSHVRVFNGVNRNVLIEFFAFDAGFRGGVRVAAGDVNGDGKADIICAAGPGGGPHVKVFDGTTGQLLREFFAYEATFRGGVFVSAADVTNDGKVDIATGAGDGGGPAVAIWDGATTGLLTRFNAYPPSIPGSGLLSGDSIWASGTRVALADTDGDGVAELYVGPGRGRAGALKGYSFNFFGEIWSQAAADPTFLGGMYVGS